MASWTTHPVSNGFAMTAVASSLAGALDCCQQQALHCNFARTSRAQHKPSWTLTALTLRRSHKGQWHRGLPWLYGARELRVAGAVCHVGGKAGRTSERVLLGKGTVSPELFASCGFRNSELKDLNACLVWTLLPFMALIPGIFVPGIWNRDYKTPGYRHPISN